MQISALPDDLQLIASGDVQLFRYRTFSDTLNSKIRLRKNVISFLQCGVKEIIGPNKRRQIESDQFIIVPAGGRLMTETISPTSNYFESILLFFSSEIAQRILDRLEIDQTEQVPRSFYAFEYDDYVHNYVDSLITISNMKPQAQGALLAAKLEEILFYLAQKNQAHYIHSIIQCAGEQGSPLVSVVERNKLNKLSLQDLAFLCNMSVSTFKREFGRHFDESPIRWFQKRRLEHAALVLRTRRVRAVEIYEEAGYSSFTNFVQAFKKEFGKTPREYQKANLNF